MPAANHHLTTIEMAQFVAEGYLRFDAIVPAEINKRVIKELPILSSIKFEGLRKDWVAGGVPIPTAAIDQTVSNNHVTLPSSGCRLSECYTANALGEFLQLPKVQGIINSLVGVDPIFDHDWVHLLPASSQFEQHLHVDAVMDSSAPTFDIQLFYFPHTVAPGEGGTRFLPGSHLRKVRAEGVSRYQHVIGRSWVYQSITKV